MKRTLRLSRLTYPRIPDKLLYCTSVRSMPTRIKNKWKKNRVKNELSLFTVVFTALYFQRVRREVWKLQTTISHLIFCQLITDVFNGWVDPEPDSCTIWNNILTTYPKQTRRWKRNYAGWITCEPPNRHFRWLQRGLKRTSRSTTWRTLRIVMTWITRILWIFWI